MAKNRDADEQNNPGFIRFDAMIDPNLSKAKKPRSLTGKYNLQIFGDESTSDHFVTYGLVAFADKQSAYRAQVAWNQTIKKFGAPSGSKVHASKLFSGQARQRTCWAHLDEKASADLVLQLAKAVKREGSFCSIGVVHLRTFPQNGIDDFTSGEKKYTIWETPEFYYFGFMSAALGLKRQIMEKDTKYSLWIDPLSDTIKLFHSWKNVQITRMIDATVLRPTAFDEEPQLLDAADLFAYAAGRAVSDQNARNKQVCTDIYTHICDVRADSWCTSGTSMMYAISDTITDPHSRYGKSVFDASDF